MKNQVQLIAYVDRLSGGTIHDLQNLLTDVEGDQLEAFQGKKRAES